MEGSHLLDVCTIIDRQVAAESRLILHPRCFWPVSLPVIGAPALRRGEQQPFELRDVRVEVQMVGYGFGTWGQVRWECSRAEANGRPMLAPVLQGALWGGRVGPRFPRRLDRYTA